MLIIGNSILEGVGTALLIPPVYILTTMLFDRRHLARPSLRGDQRDGRHRRRRRSADRRPDHHGDQLAGRVRLPGARRRWRSCCSSRRLVDPAAADPTRSFDTVGAVLSAVGLVLVVMGILAADDNGWLMRRCSSLPARSSSSPSSSTSAAASATARSRCSPRRCSATASPTSGSITQNVQWLLLMGTSFVVSAYLQVVRGYNAIQTGVIFTAATVGILASSLAAERLAKRRSQRTLIVAGFVTTIVGVVVLLALVNGSPQRWAFAPGLLLIGLGVGVMLTPSVNVVQSAFPEDLQGEISGLSRCISNLGSSLGTAVAGTILVAGLTETRSVLRAWP